jgi:hypothetical protein
MAYRVFYLDEEGRIDKIRVLSDCGCDDDAIKQAKAIRHPFGLELWHLARHVASIKTDA